MDKTTNNNTTQMNASLRSVIADADQLKANTAVLFHEEMKKRIDPLLEKSILRGLNESLSNEVGMEDMDEDDAVELEMDTEVTESDEEYTEEEDEMPVSEKSVSRAEFVAELLDEDGEEMDDDDTEEVEVEDEEETTTVKERYMKRRNESARYNTRSRYNEDDSEETEEVILNDEELEEYDDEDCEEEEMAEAADLYSSFRGKRYLMVSEDDSEDDVDDDDVEVVHIEDEEEEEVELDAPIAERGRRRNHSGRAYERYMSEGDNEDGGEYEEEEPEEEEDDVRAAMEESRRRRKIREASMMNRHRSAGRRMHEGDDTEDEEEIVSVDLEEGDEEEIVTVDDEPETKSVSERGRRGGRRMGEAGSGSYLSVGRRRFSLPESDDADAYEEQLMPLVEEDEEVVDTEAEEKVEKLEEALRREKRKVARLVTENKQKDVVTKKATTAVREAKLQQEKVVAITGIIRQYNPAKNTLTKIVEAIEKAKSSADIKKVYKNASSVLRERVQKVALSERATKSVASKRNLFNESTSTSKSKRSPIINEDVKSFWKYEE